MKKGMLRAQSAMEYLMTYGWAILIIAVVLGALFSLGVFSGTSLLGNACIASPGFYCTSMSYVRGLAPYGGNIVVTVGQNTGTAWTGTMFMFAQQGLATTTGVPNVLFSNAQTSLLSGQTVTVQLPYTANTAAATPVGTSASGSLWVCYSTTSGVTMTSTVVGTCTASAGSPSYAQIATLTAKAS